MGYLSYTIQYIKGSHNQPADFLSRAPLEVCDNKEVEDKGTFLNFIEGFNIPINAQFIRVQTAADSILKRVMDYVKFGWP